MFERVFNVPYYGLDTNGRVKTGLLLQFLQEAAALHADTVGIGVASMIERGLTWVLRRYRVRILRHAGQEGLSVRTWFEPKRNLVSVRLFEISDLGGNPVARAWSGWIVVDLKRVRPVRLDRALPENYFACSEPTGEELGDPVETVGEACDAESRFRVRRQELDLNGHANHTAYFDWASESVPDEDVKGLSPIELDAEYIAPVMREDVTVRTRRLRESPPRYAHSVVIDCSGAEAARLAVTWGDEI
ncbi:MAG: hypothetical protein LBQ56_07450 [Synergistaceae bacterium]|jgi:acyl-ACP thioesterase|nr:hypothetical protein [Synergistaceae bacterium]